MMIVYSIYSYDGLTIVTPHAKGVDIPEQYSFADDEKHLISVFATMYSLDPDMGKDFYGDLEELRYYEEFEELEIAND